MTLRDRVLRSCTASTLSILILSVAATPAGAQSRPEDRPLRAAAGYVFSHSSQGGFSESFPVGFGVQLSRDVKRDEKKALGFVGRYSLGFHNDDEFSDRLSVFQVGARMTWHQNPLRPYVLGMLGFARLHFSDDEFSGSETGVAYSAGAGISKPLANGKRAGVEASVGQHRQGSPVFVFTLYGFIEVDMDKLKK